jgi:16S rRNA pseudouridine516 synthase
MRLDKYLAHTGYGSRTDVKKLIKKGIVFVDDALCTDPGFEITQHRVTLEGQPVKYQAFYYFMMNKPKGVLSASKDTRQPTVLDLMKDAAPVAVHVVGRLDKDTTGLLLLTNDGQLAHTIISPKTKVAKHYHVTINEPLTEEEITRLEQGIVLDGQPTLPCQIHSVHETTYEMVLMEGRFHQIKRMMHHVKKEVLQLHRFKIGALLLDPNLNEGEYRELRDVELELFSVL